MSPTFTTTPSPLGSLTLVGTERGLSGVYFENQRHWPKDSTSWTPENDRSRFAPAVEALCQYFAGQTKSFSFALDLSSGTPFQISVWKALRKIPYGKTWTYGQLAEKIGAPTAVRAVAAAVGRNPLSLIIPCHRVIGRDGSLTGYAGGLDRKQWLLAHEGVKPTS
jgi:methylated-DNA-[protein]-cysteine S-methyltransferase